MTIPLTHEESAFAAENHDLVDTYLKIKKYSFSEFYDIAIFGYLRAVRTYLSRADLQAAYDFRAIAFQCMRSEISHHFQKEKRRKTIAEMLPYEDNDVACGAESIIDTVSKRHTAQSVREKLPEILTPRQSNIVYLKAQGYNNCEVAAQCGLGETSIRRELKNAHDAVRNNAPELLELIAA